MPCLQKQVKIQEIQDRKVLKEHKDQLEKWAPKAPKEIQALKVLKPGGAPRPSQRAPLSNVPRKISHPTRAQPQRPRLTRCPAPRRTHRRDAGRLAISDVVNVKELPEHLKTDEALAC